MGIQGHERRPGLGMPLQYGLLEYGLLEYLEYTGPHGAAAGTVVSK